MLGHNEEIRGDSVKLIWDCRTACMKTLYNHCVMEGGEHVEPAHVKIMTDCIQICQAAADFMTRGSDAQKSVCAACAEICEACAKSCEAIDDDEMKSCADICRRCAESCREMSRTA